MTRITSLSLILLLSATALGAETNTAKLVERWLWYPKEMDMTSLSETQRAEVIAEFRKAAASEAVIGFQSTAKILLFRLSDTQTIARVVQDIRGDDWKKRSDGWSAFEYASNPILIPYLAELLYFSEKVESGVNPGSDVGYITRPLRAALAIQNIICRSPEFTPEVKSWTQTEVWMGERTMVLGEQALYRSIRLLWEKHKGVFRRGDYVTIKLPNPLTNATQTNLATKVERWIWYTQEMKETAMSESERRDVIAELYRAESIDQYRSRYLLLRLGDSQTVKAVIEDLRKDRTTKEYLDALVLLQVVKNPVVIPYLAELLYHPEEVGRDYLTRPQLAAFLIHNIIHWRSEFSAEIIKWVQGWYGLSDPNKDHRVTHDLVYRSIRQLWEENKEAFIRHDFAAVKLPKTLPRPLPEVATNQMPSTVVAPPAKP